MGVHSAFREMMDQTRLPCEFLAQIRSAVPEIFEVQTKKKQKKSQTALKTEHYLRAVK